jgi:hypothetical protein
MVDCANNTVFLTSDCCFINLDLSGKFNFPQLFIASMTFCLNSQQVFCRKLSLQLSSVLEIPCLLELM